MSRVVKICSAKAVSMEGEIVPTIVRELLRKGLSLLGGNCRWDSYLHTLVSPSSRLGIKINTIAGRRLSTQPETSLAAAEVLHASGTRRQDIIIWDRTNRELKEAGYTLNQSGREFRVLGTDTRGIGYTKDLTAHRSIGSRISRIQSEMVDVSFSLAILKDHGIAGITAGMKNYFGAIHNPNKYHDNHCDPFVADVFDSPPVKNKHRLSILDALTVQVHMGPSFHSRWAERAGTLILSEDPVAADFTGWQMIEDLRAGSGLPSLAEEKRNPAYLGSAAEINLGRADFSQIELIESEL
jgi:uncharacterized protein (DUF362 family)